MGHTAAARRRVRHAKYAGPGVIIDRKAFVELRSPVEKNIRESSLSSSVCQTYSAQAIAYIKQCLLDGTLSPGDPIREVGIAAHLGISRGPVREALQLLQQQGLVTGAPQKAKFIRQMTAGEIEDSYCLGGTLEGACIVQSLPALDEAALAEMEGILYEMETQSRIASGLSALSQIDERFHEALLSRCGNRLMVNTARSSCAHISKFLYYKYWDTLFSPQEFYQRHQAILAAVRSRDAQRIEQTLREHYAESGRRLALACGRQPEA